MNNSIECGFNINISHGYTPFHWSARNGHADVSKLLLENGANVNEKDEYGYTRGCGIEDL